MSKVVSPDEQMAAGIKALTKDDPMTARYILRVQKVGLAEGHQIKVVLLIEV